MVEKSVQHLTTELRAFLEKQRRQLGREIGERRAQIATINKLLGTTDPQEVERHLHSDLTENHL